MAISLDRLRSRIETLARFGALPGGGVTRSAWSPAYEEARAWLLSEMRGAGLAAWVDPAGNIFGGLGTARLCERDSSRTHRLAHRYRPRRGHSRRRPRRPRGPRMPPCHQGARAPPIAGPWWSRRGATRRDATEVSSAREPFVACSTPLGCRRWRPPTVSASSTQWPARDSTPWRAPRAQVPPGGVAAYVELHIEQGPRLDEAGIPIGVVESIVGVRRTRIIFNGQADHAGTTPMERRRDAFLAAADYATKARDLVVKRGGGRSVTNVGVVHVHPGVSNVVPARCEIVHEMRVAGRGRAGRARTRVRVTGAPGEQAPSGGPRDPSLVGHGPCPLRATRPGSGGRSEHGARSALSASLLGSGPRRSEPGHHRRLRA